jgi:hypothetical protein
MNDREAGRESSSIAELIRRTKCDQKTCPNFDHNCLVINGRIHHTLTANDFSIWDKAIKDNKATLDLPPLNVRGSAIVPRKSQVAITNHNAMPFNMGFPVPYPFMGGYPMPGYPQCLPPIPPAVPPTPIAPTAAPLTPIRNVNRSSPIEIPSDVNKNISGYIDWMIKANPDDYDELNKAKVRLIEDLADLKVIKTISREDCMYWNIPWGLGKRMACEVKEFIEETQ